MLKSKNLPLRSNNSVTLFIDYTLAELRKGKDWLIVYYVKNPLSEKLERHRLRVPKHSNARQRELQAKRIIEEINKRLQKGWSPYLESKDVFYTDFSICLDLFLKHTELDVQKNVKRPDTLRAYKSYISILRKYIEEESVNITFVLHFNRSFIVNYLDWLFYTRNVSNETWNNHLTFLTNLGNWMIDKGYIKENPATGLKRKPKSTKVRTLISDHDKAILLGYFKEKCFGYYILTLLTYGCFIRRTEATLLKVSDIDLSRNVIRVRKEVSKNKKDEIVTIPNEIIPLLAKHLQNANNSDFLFSKDEFIPGSIQLNPKKISDYFAKVRKLLKLPSSIQFYSWKDTGITKLFEEGVALIKIRDQARHYDISMTEKYTHRIKEADPDLMNNSLNL